MGYESVVYMLPGFLGFDKIGSFYYFADRVSAFLRGRLEQQLGRLVPVIPIACGPTEGLARRQQRFLTALTSLDERLGSPQNVHLFGHSTGGLDAELLLHERRLDDRPWTPEQQSLRQRIRSVSTIAAPHHGTTLALSDISRWLRDPVMNVASTGAAIPALLAVLRVWQQRSQLAYRLAGDASAVRSFVQELSRDRDLLDDLQPESVELLRTKNPRALEAVQVTCFVSCALPNPGPILAREEAPDAFFLYLVNQTAGARSPASEAVKANINRLNRCTDIICSASKEPRAPHRFDAVDNDAVVNSARQLLSYAELGAIVHADHADVLGHYDRRDPLNPSRFINSGVFRSGARFGDDEFFTLYGRVASSIAKSELRAPHAGDAPPARIAPHDAASSRLSSDDLAGQQ